MRNRRDVTPGEEQAIRTFMDRLAQAPSETGAVPHPDVIWLRVHLLQRWEAERRMTLPLDVIEPVQVLAALAATILLVAWSLPPVMRALMP